MGHNYDNNPEFMQNIDKLMNLRGNYSSINDNYGGEVMG